MASRDIYIAPDDTSYINHFLGNLDIKSDNILLLLFVEEPIWKYYTKEISDYFDSETSFRLTIFMSSLMILYRTYIYSNGGGLFWLLTFILTGPLATQLYFNQIRQGFALSVFIFGLSRGKKSGLISSIISSFIHSSFYFIFIVYLFSFFSYSLKKSIYKIVSLFAISIIFIFLLSTQKNILLQYAGRRSELIEFEQKLNINYYIIFISLFAIVLYYTWEKKASDDYRFFWSFSFNYIFIVHVITFVSDVGRLIYFTQYFLPLVIMKGHKRKNFKILAVFWISFFLIFNIYQYKKEYPIIYDTVFGRWESIIL